MCQFNMVYSYGSWRCLQFIEVGNFAPTHLTENGRIYTVSGVPDYALSHHISHV